MHKVTNADIDMLFLYQIDSFCSIIQMNNSFNSLNLYHYAKKYFSNRMLNCKSLI